MPYWGSGRYTQKCFTENPMPVYAEGEAQYGPKFCTACKRRF